SPTLQEAIRTVSHEVHRIITNPPNNRNITEWCKRKECWDQVRETKIDLGGALEQELIDVGSTAGRQPNRSIEGPNEQDIALIKQVSDVPADEWFQISKWAKETNNLQGWQRSIAFSIGKIVARGGAVSPKQAKQGVRILEEVEALGFRAAESVD